MRTSTKSLIKILITLSLFLVWGILAKGGRLEAFDQAVQSAFFSIRCGFLTGLGASLEYLGHWPIPAAVSIALLLSKKTRVPYGLPLALSVLSSVGLYEIFKHIFKRLRPDQIYWLVREHGYSFPSGHSMNNMVFWLVFAFLLRYYFAHRGENLPIFKNRGNSRFLALFEKSALPVPYPKTPETVRLFSAACIFWPLLIALSRIYVGVHWPSDVIGAWILGCALLMTAKTVLTERD